MFRLDETLVDDALARSAAACSRTVRSSRSVRRTLGEISETVPGLLG
jgi:hypothetical protein